MVADNITDRVPADARSDIQGNLVGFNKDHERLIFVRFPDRPQAQAFLSEMLAEATNAAEVLDINSDYKRMREEGQDLLTRVISEANIALTSAGLALVCDQSDIAAFPLEFQQGMRARASVLGDVEASDPSNWVAPFNTSDAVHAMVIVAADTPDLLDQRSAAIRASIARSGVTEATPAHDGNTRPGVQAGHEHFGFKDGISQPSIAGLTRSSKEGDVIAAGEFLLGYANQDSEISGQPPVTEPAPPSPGYNPTPPAPPAPQLSLPAWARNGSFVVYRRLRQDVSGFRQFLAEQAPSVTLSPEQLAAKLVGRWPSGAPLEHVPGLPATLDPSTADPADAHPDVLLDQHINRFDYEDDADGHRVPRAAHIRKAYPRHAMPPGPDEANRHRIARRGIPYGPEVIDAEPPYPGAAPVPDAQDRGLLFLCYQADLARGFEFIQQSWANNPDFPQPGDGQDPISSQNKQGAPFTLPPNGHLALQRWVTTTGGDYFFAPSISALRMLAGKP